MALRRSNRVEQKKWEEAYRLGEVFMAAARRVWESPAGQAAKWPLEAECLFEKALKKCSKRGQVLVNCYLHDQPVPEEIEE